MIRLIKLFVFSISVLLFISCDLSSSSNTDTEETPTPNATATPTPEATPNPFTLKKLTTDGPLIIEAATGKEIDLKGIVFTSGVWINPGTDDPSQFNYMHSSWDFQNVKSWGANTIVLYIDYYWFQTQEGYDYFNNILRLCRLYNLYIVPTLNVYPGGQNRGGIEFFENETNKDLLDDFWAGFAERYKNHNEIAGYCIMDEPELDGSETYPWDEWNTVIGEYSERLIDTIREIDDITPIFVQGRFGGVGDNILGIDSSKEHIVYDCHFYDPHSYTHAGYPWLANGGVPRDVTYPGNYVSSITETSNEMFTHDAEGDFDWQSFECEAVIPSNTNMAFIGLYCTGPEEMEVYFDDIEYSITYSANPNPSAFSSLPYGSFEESNPYDGSMLVWIQNPGTKENGMIERTSDYATDGDYSIHMHTCSDLTILDSTEFWASSVAGIEIDPAAMASLSVRVNIRGENVGSEQYGILIRWMDVSYGYLDASAIEGLVDSLMIQKRTDDSRPIFVGEFSPSLVAPRPDIINYLNDLLDSFNENGLHWSYYHYRDCNVLPDELYMGIYNGTQGTETRYSQYIDTDVINALKAHY